MTSLGSAPPRSARRSALVFALTALGAFIASLDQSIVNVAYPSIRRTWPGTSAAGLADPDRLQHRVRLVARRRGSHR